MNVLIITEDHELDQYVVKPIIERVMKEAGRKARVDVLTDPHLRGADDALDLEMVAAIVADNQGMTDLFILIVDRDCDRQSNASKAASRESEHGALLACVAQHEVEVWMMAAFDKKALPVSVKELRAHCDPKEKFADPFIAARGWSKDLGRGRRPAMREGLRGSGFRRLLNRCEELGQLVDKIRALP